MEPNAVKLRRWQSKIFLLCWLCYSLAYFGRVNIAVALPGLGEYFQTDLAAVGIMGSAFFGAYAIGQLINGILSSRFGSRGYIFVGLAVSGVCNIFISISNSFVLSILLWGLNGLAQSMLWVSIVKTAGLWFQPKQYSKVMVGLNTSMVLGFFLAWGGSGLVIRILSWRFVFLIPGILIVLFAFVWLKMSRNSPNDESLRLPSEPSEKEEKENENETALKTGQRAKDVPLLSYKKLIFSSGLLFVVVACMAQGMVKEGLGVWGPSIIMRLYGLTIDMASFYAMLIPVMNLAGIFFAGILNALFGHRVRITILGLLAIAFVTFGAVWLFAENSLAAGIVGIATASGAMFGANTMLLGALPLGYSKYNMAAFTAGFLNFFSYVGAGLSSIMLGRVLDTRPQITDIFIIWVVVTFIAITSVSISLRKKYLNFIK